MLTTLMHDVQINPLIINTESRNTSMNYNVKYGW